MSLGGVCLFHNSINPFVYFSNLYAKIAAKIKQKQLRHSVNPII